MNHAPSTPSNRKNSRRRGRNPSTGASTGTGGTPADDEPASPDPGGLACDAFDPFVCGLCFGDRRPRFGDFT